MAFQLSTHTCMKNTCKKGKQGEYRPREGPGTARTLRCGSTPNVFGCLCQIQGNGILHTLLMKRQHCICVFILASLLPSPLYLFFFLIASFPLPFSSSLPIPTLSRETHRMWCRHSQLFSPFPRTSSPAHNWPVQLLRG